MWEKDEGLTTDGKEFWIFDLRFLIGTMKTSLGVSSGQKWQEPKGTEMEI
jgi:hypothetical protein